MRNFFPVFFVTLVLTGLGGLAYFTQNPQSPWLEKAQEWPVVGKLAKDFRRAYLGPEAVGEPPVVLFAEEIAEADASGDMPEEPIRLDLPVTEQWARHEARENRGASPPDEAAPEDSAGTQARKPVWRSDQGAADESGAARSTRVEQTAMRPSIPRPSRRTSIPDDAEWHWFLPGQAVASSPGDGGIVRQYLSSMAYLPILERDGEWGKVIFQQEEGWIDTSWEPSFSRRKARRGIARHRTEPIRASSTQRLKKARKILGVDRPSRKLGPYDLFTDIEDESLLDFLDQTAQRAEDAYFARFGRLPSGDPRRSIVFFADKDSYVEYSGDELGLRSAGHAGGGTLVFFAENRTRADIARTLVHEIAHLVNTRALTGRLPTWLEEGMASELGTVIVEDKDMASEVFGGASMAHPALVDLNLGIFRLRSLIQGKELPSVGILMQLTYELFHRPEIQSYGYAHSGAFVRFLLDGYDGTYREEFRSFLGQIAAGYAPTADLLTQELNEDVETLDRRFQEWVLAEGERIQADFERRGISLRF